MSSVAPTEPEVDPVVDLREYIEALFREKERALDMAAAERDRAAEVLRDEQRRALLVAETEREKAAAALRAGTDRAIADNFSRVMERIDALIRSAEEAERHRRELDDAKAKAVDAAFAAAEKAVAKAEEAQGRVNIAQNEFRGQLADQASTLMPRKEVEALLAEQTRQVSEIRDALGQLRTAVAVGPSGLIQLQEARARTEGKAAGITAMQSLAISLGGLFIAGGGLLIVILTHKGG
jgi:hypothetical protein